MAKRKVTIVLPKASVDYELSSTDWLSHSISTTHPYIEFEYTVPSTGGRARLYAVGIPFIIEETADLS